MKDMNEFLEFCEKHGIDIDYTNRDAGGAKGHFVRLASPLEPHLSNMEVVEIDRTEGTAIEACNIALNTLREKGWKSLYDDTNEFVLVASFYMSDNFKQNDQLEKLAEHVSDDISLDICYKIDREGNPVLYFESRFYATYLEDEINTFLNRMEEAEESIMGFCDDIPTYHCQDRELSIVTYIMSHHNPGVLLNEAALAKIVFLGCSVDFDTYNTVE